MTTARARSTAAQRVWQGIGRDVERAHAGSGPVEIALSKSEAIVGEDELVVLVLTRRQAIVSRQRGRAGGAEMRRLRLSLAAAEAAVDHVAGAGPLAVPQLTDAEASLLDGAGFKAGDPDAPTAMERARIELELLMAESMTLAEAAKALGVSAARLRQRLGPSERTLFGVKEGRSWRIPLFQFQKGGRKVIRGLERVLPRVRRDAHPLAVARWFMTPNPDLVVGEDERPVTPTQWLSAGRDADAVASLAEEI